MRNRNRRQSNLKRIRGLITGAKAVMAVAVFFICLIALNYQVGPTTCVDGWQSPSIGHQGACSWHGGVDYAGHAILLLLIVTESLLAGWAAAKVTQLLLALLFASLIWAAGIVSPPKARSSFPNP
jgi:hypothetical protein